MSYMEQKEMTVEFDSLANTPKEIATELNDIKLILLSIAFKLEEEERKQLFEELSPVKSKGMQQWLANLKKVDIS